MANRTDAILLLASSSFLALGLATWYERANDKPFDFVSIFGDSVAHAAPAKPANNKTAIEKSQPVSSALKTERVATKANVADTLASPQTIVTPVQAVKPASLTSTSTLSNTVEKQTVETKAMQAKSEPQNEKLAMAVQPRPAARTVTIVLSPSPAPKNKITTLNVESEVDIAETINLAEELSSETDGSDASSLLSTKDGPSADNSTTTFKSIENSSAANDQPFSSREDQITHNNPELEDAPSPLNSVEEIAEKNQQTSYRVEAGDNLYRIALTHGTSVDALKQLNALQSDKLHVGDELQLP